MAWILLENDWNLLGKENAVLSFSSFCLRFLLCQVKRQSHLPNTYPRLCVVCKIFKKADGIGALMAARKIIAQSPIVGVPPSSMTWNIAHSFCHTKYITVLILEEPNENSRFLWMYSSQLLFTGIKSLDPTIKTIKRRNLHCTNSSNQKQHIKLNPRTL